MCYSKEFGSLGIKVLDIFNPSLLGSWRWRLLVDNEAVWSKLIQFMYGNLNGASSQQRWDS